MVLLMISESQTVECSGVHPEQFQATGPCKNQGGWDTNETCVLTLLETYMCDYMTWCQISKHGPIIHQNELDSMRKQGSTCYEYGQTKKNNRAIMDMAVHLRIDGALIMEE